MLSRPEDPGANYPYSPEADANSRLICAAPDLLALAERLAETVKLCHDCKWDVLKHELVHLMTGLESEAKEAIDKAKGGE
jgi:hypothetical protein